MPINRIYRAPPVMAQAAAQAAPKATPARAGCLVPRLLVAVFNRTAAPAMPPQRAALRGIVPQQARPLPPVIQTPAQIPRIRPGAPHLIAQPPAAAPPRPAAPAHPAVPGGNRPFLDNKPRRAPVQLPAKTPPAVAAKNPVTVQKVHQTMHGMDRVRTAGKPAPAPVAAKPGGREVERHVELPPRAKQRLGHLVKEHLQAKRKASPNAQHYVHLVAKGHVTRGGQYRPATTYHFGTKIQPSDSWKLAPPTRYEYGPALPHNDATTGGFKHVAKHMKPSQYANKPLAGDWLLLEANRPNANLAGNVTVHANELAGLSYVIATDFVDTNRAFVRNGGTNLFDLTDQRVRLHPDNFRGVVGNLIEMHRRGITNLDIKGGNLTLSAKDNAVRMIDTDGLVRVGPLNVLTFSIGYMPEKLHRPIYDGVKSAFFTADEYAMLLTIVESTLTEPEANDPDFVRGCKDIFNRNVRQVAYNAKTRKILDQWIARHIRPIYQQHAKLLLSDPLQYSQQRESKSYPTLDKMLFQ